MGDLTPSVVPAGVAHKAHAATVLVEFAAGISCIAVLLIFFHCWYYRYFPSSTLRLPPLHPPSALLLISTFTSIMNRQCCPSCAGLEP